jgi:hypothetical protein
VSAPYEYVAYIDESGDPGLATVRPIDPGGSSEWLMVAAVVVSRKNERAPITWMHDILALMKSPQMREIHFRLLNDDQKRAACSYVAGCEARLFVIASNKKNMKGYLNPYAAQVSLDKNWFYCWLTRMLLERVTNWVHRHSIKAHGEPRPLRIEYSERGGLSYSQMHAYQEILRMQSGAGSLTLPHGDLCWDVMAYDEMHVFNHSERAGLQVADIVASAFFAAADKHNTGGCRPEFAKLLEPRMARADDRQRGMISGYGFKLMPSMLRARLDPDQREIFSFYGYPRQWWDPALSNQAAHRWATSPLPTVRSTLRT